MQVFHPVAGRAFYSLDPYHTADDGRSALHLHTGTSRGLQTDDVYLCWPIALFYTGPNAGDTGGCWVSANEYSCAHHVTLSPHKLWRATSIFNLWVQASVHINYTTKPTARVTMLKLKNVWKFLHISGGLEWIRCKVIKGTITWDGFYVKFVLSMLLLAHSPTTQSSNLAYLLKYWTKWKF